VGELGRRCFDARPCRWCSMPENHRPGRRSGSRDGSGNERDRIIKPHQCEMARPRSARRFAEVQARNGSRVHSHRLATSAVTRPERPSHRSCEPDGTCLHTIDGNAGWPPSATAKCLTVCSPRGSRSDRRRSRLAGGRCSQRAAADVAGGRRRAGGHDGTDVIACLGPALTVENRSAISQPGGEAS